jgi:hypothetical protein
VSCPLFPEDCATDHLSSALGLRCTQVGQQWSGACPVHGERKFSLGLGTKGRRFVWNCHHDPPCSPSSLYEWMLDAGAKAECLGRPGGRHRKPGLDTDLAAIEKLLAEDWRSPAGLRVQIGARLWDCAPDMAARKLGYARATIYRILAEVPGRPKYR